MFVLFPKGGCRNAFTGRLRALVKAQFGQGLGSGGIFEDFVFGMRRMADMDFTLSPPAGESFFISLKQGWIVENARPTCRKKADC